MRARQKVSRAGIELIKSFEGLRSLAEKLPDGRWTVGYGHTFSAREGAKVTAEDADALLRYDLMPVSECLNADVHVRLTQNQFDALASFCFNIGVEAFRTSDVLKRLNEGRMTDAALAMDAWHSAEFDGQTYVLAPLIRRRAAEKALFLTPEQDEVPPSSPMVKPVVNLAPQGATPVETTASVAAPQSVQTAPIQPAPVQATPVVTPPLQAPVQIQAPVQAPVQAPAPSRPEVIRLTDPAPAAPQAPEPVRPASHTPVPPLARSAFADQAPNQTPVPPLVQASAPTPSPTPTASTPPVAPVSSAPVVAPRQTPVVPTASDTVAVTGSPDRILATTPVSSPTEVRTEQDPAPRHEQVSVQAPVQTPASAPSPARDAAASLMMSFYSPYAGMGSKLSALGTPPAHANATQANPEKPQSTTPQQQPIPVAAIPAEPEPVQDPVKTDNERTAPPAPAPRPMAAGFSGMLPPLKPAAAPPSAPQNTAPQPAVVTTPAAPSLMNAASFAGTAPQTPQPARPVSHIPPDQRRATPEPVSSETEEPLPIGLTAISPAALSPTRIPPSNLPPPQVVAPSASQATPRPSAVPSQASASVQQSNAQVVPFPSRPETGAAARPMMSAAPQTAPQASAQGAATAQAYSPPLTPPIPPVDPVEATLRQQPPMVFAPSAQGFVSQSEYDDEDGWDTAVNGRIAVPETDEVETSGRNIQPLLLMGAVSTLGIMALGAAMASFLRAKEQPIAPAGFLENYSNLAIILAVAGVTCISISVYFFLKRLGGVRD